jgi:hypothetical protein
MESEMETRSFPQDVDALTAAVVRILTEMGDGMSISLAAKAQARISLEPFADDFLRDLIMPIEDAQRILAEQDE